MGVHTRCFITVVIIANELIDKYETSGNSLCYESWTLNDEGTFFITNTATPDEASQSLNPRVC
jgi:hypothetical protein